MQRFPTMNQAKKNIATPDTMRYWIARTLRTTREEKGVSRDAIRMLVPGRDGNPMDASTLSRFESGQTWPRELDSLVPAYAAMCGIEDPRDLWRQAIDDYLEHGTVPHLGSISPSLQSVILALEAAQRPSRHDDESQDKPNATQKKQANG